MEQGQVQIRVIKELLATGYDYMELHDFADAYRSSMREYHSSEVGEARLAWLHCSNAITNVAAMRFTLEVWIAHLNELASLPNLTITRK